MSYLPSSRASWAYATGKSAAILQGQNPVPSAISLPCVQPVSSLPQIPLALSIAKPVLVQLAIFLLIQIPVWRLVVVAGAPFLASFQLRFFGVSPLREYPNVLLMVF